MPASSLRRRLFLFAAIPLGIAMLPGTLAGPATDELAQVLDAIAATEKTAPRDRTDPAAVVTAVSPPPAIQDMSQLPGFALLSPREVELCKSVQLLPAQYLEIKKTLIAESLRQGLLDDKQKQQQQHRGSYSGKSNKKGSYFPRSLVKIDVERHGAVIDFVVRAGWIPSTFAKSVREVMM